MPEFRVESWWQKMEQLRAAKVLHKKKMRTVAGESCPATLPPQAYAPINTHARQGIWGRVFVPFNRDQGCPPTWKS